MTTPPTSFFMAYPEESLTICYPDGVRAIVSIASDGSPQMLHLVKNDEEEALEVLCTVETLARLNEVVAYVSARAIVWDYFSAQYGATHVGFRATVLRWDPKRMQAIANAIRKGDEGFVNASVTAAEKSSLTEDGTGAGGEGLRRRRRTRWPSATTRRRDPLRSEHTNGAHRGRALESGRPCSRG